MEWTTEENGKRLTVKVDGRFVAAVVPAVREDIIGRIKDGMTVVFDLEKMTHIDSSGIGALVQILQKAKAHNGKVILAALQAGPKIVFDITKVNRVFDIVPTVADAPAE
ncbi:MAG: STAS domain-containing protein [Kiritimatiellae bacterium]|nr:STAS domain-containing protein [Kiritimatiellia bacterium]